MTATVRPTGPLNGVRVLDLGEQIAGPLVGMLLADQGADVIKVIRSPGGSLGDAIAAVLDRGKRCVSIDLDDPHGRESIVDLVRQADVVIQNNTPRGSRKWRLQVADIHALNADAVVVSLPGSAEGDTLLGDAEPFEGIVAAATGQFTNIHAARQVFGLDPVYTALPLASVYAGVHGATAVVIALRQRAAGACETVIEVPLVNAALSAMSSLHLRVERQPERYDAPRLPAALKKFALPLMRAWARSGGKKAQAKLLEIARGAYPALMTSYACADGRLLYVFAVDNAKLVRATLSVLGVLDGLLAEGLVFEDPFTAGDRRDNLSESSNLSRKWQARLKAVIGESLKARPAIEWETLLNASGVTCAVQRTTKEWLALPELRAAGIVVEVDDPLSGPSTQPGAQVTVTGSGGSTQLPAARQIAGHGSAVAWSSRPPAPPRQSSRLATPMAPGTWLRGLTVIDMSSMVAGPVAGRTFAEYGARVIKVETPTPNHGPRLTCWYGIDGNQGKDSVLLDLKTQGGYEAMRRLLAGADVLITNHSAAAMAALGLGDEDLRLLKPGLIHCRIGAYNGPSDGPWKQRPGYDPVLQAASGIMARYGDPGVPELHAIASCVDALTGYSAAFGTAVALLVNHGDNDGTVVDASLAAAATLVQLPFAFDYAGRTWDEPTGQFAKGEQALYRLYKARDGWLFVAAPGASQSDLPARLRPEKTTDTAGLATHLEIAIGRRTIADTLALLSSSGLSAAPVQSNALLARLLTGANGLRLERRTVPSLGTVVVAPGQQVSSGGGLASLTPAQKPGESTGRVLREIGLDAEALFSTGAAAREVSNDYLPA